MITIFNRKELFITYSMEKQAELRSTLATNGIDYKIRTVSHANTRARSGSFGINQNFSYEHIFYVKRADYEKAIHFVR